MITTLECTPTEADTNLFFSENYVALAEWRDHSWGSLTLYKILTERDQMYLKLDEIIQGWTDGRAGVMTTMKVRVNGEACELHTDYNIARQRMHFVLRSVKESVSRTVDQRELR